MMFFRRAKKENQKPASESNEANVQPVDVQPVEVAEALPVAPPAIVIVSEPAEVIETPEPPQFDFASTDDLEPLSGVVGQDRAVAAIEFAATMKRGGFHTVVVGASRTGRRTAVRAAVTRAALARSAPPDIVYVGSLEPDDRLRALKLASGLGVVLQKGMLAAIDELKETLPAAFLSDDFTTRQRLIDEDARSERDDALADLQHRAEAVNIAVLRTPTGYALAPVHEGRVVKPDVFKALPESLRNEVQSKLRALEAELERILSSAPQSDKVRRSRLKALHTEMSREVVRNALEDLRDQFKTVPEVLSHLEAVEDHIVNNVRTFLPSDGIYDSRSAGDARLRRYAVHVVSTRPPEVAVPLVEDPSPTLLSLFGSAEQLEANGSGEPAGWRVTPGSLHQANGGVLLINAHRLLLEPMALEALQHAIEDGEIRLVSAERSKVARVNAESVPLDVKVILFAEPDVWRRIGSDEPDFKRLFKVEVVFDGHIARSDQSEKMFARHVAYVVQQNDLKPIDAEGVMALLDEASRLVGRMDKLTLELGRISDLVLEADHWSGVAARRMTTREDVETAIAERAARTDQDRMSGEFGAKS